MTYQCPDCGRVSKSNKRCEGIPGHRHAPRDVREAEHLTEALEVREPVADVRQLSG